MAMEDFERKILSDHTDKMNGCIWDPDVPPRKPTAARCDPVTDDCGELFDFMEATGTVDIM